LWLIASALAIHFVGFIGYLIGLSYIARMGFAVAFILIQFVAMFMFLGRTKAIEILPGDKTSITYDDYYGNEHIVKAVSQWTQLLKDRDKFVAMGGKPIRGLLLYGPPGSGKTWLARAMAGSEDIAFYGMDGSGFRAMFIGIDILKMMQFFGKGRKLAREYGGCILYLDEIDAVGASRGGVIQQMAEKIIEPMMMGAGMGGMGSGALTRLLYELDGLEELSVWNQSENKVRAWFGYPPVDQGQLFLMGATNRPEVLDPALTRSGRLDKRIHVGSPDKYSRRQIIEGYLAKIVHDPVDVDALVSDTPHMMPAQIAAALQKDAVRLAFFDDRDSVTQDDIDMALQEQLLGLPNPISEWEPEQRHSVAVHEAGHAIVAHYLRPYQRIVRASIVRRMSALGYVLPVEKEDRYARPLEHLAADIMVSLAGHLAVLLVFGKPWTGASSDMQHVYTRLQYLAAHGWFGWFPLNVDGQTGRPTFTSEQQKHMNQYLRDCAKEVTAILTEHREDLDRVTDALLERGDLSGADVLDLLEDNNEV